MDGLRFTHGHRFLVLPPPSHAWLIVAVLNCPPGLTLLLMRRTRLLMLAHAFVIVWKQSQHVRAIAGRPRR